MDHLSSREISEWLVYYDVLGEEQDAIEHGIDLDERAEQLIAADAADDDAEPDTDGDDGDDVEDENLEALVQEQLRALGIGPEQAAALLRDRLTESR